MGSCTDDAFARGNVGVVIGTNLPQFFIDGNNIQDDNWGNGVFYGTDANSVDQRCIYFKQYNGYDCPGGWIPWAGDFGADGSKKGAGNYASGNPNAAGGGGGGAGCHFSQYNPKGIDQFDADGTNLVGNQWCECNYALKGNQWKDWVNQWTYHGKNKPGYEWMGWGSGKKAPTFGADIGMCWVNNPRDMIMMQNAMWQMKDQWNNLLIPASNPYDANNPSSQRHYWGWNEIPLDYQKVIKPSNWDSLIIKLPPAACGDDGRKDKVDCLPNNAQAKLETLLDWYTQHSYLKLGKNYIGQRPSSYIVFLREYFVGNRAWEREFFCSSWTSPNNKYSVVFDPMSPHDKSGVCYADKAQGPPPGPPPAPAGKGGPIRLANNHNKFVDITGGNLLSGTKLEIWDCNGLATNQNFIYDDDSHTIRAAGGNNLCVDFGKMKKASPAQLWTCNGQKQQKVYYHENSKQLHNDNGDCLDLPYSSTKNGNVLQTWSCNGASGQKWEVQDDSSETA